MEHAPGPWSACHDGKCQCKMIWSIPADCHIATVISGDWGDKYPVVKYDENNTPHAEMEMITYGSVPEKAAIATAKLIAAAPDLLEACNRAFAALLQNKTLSGGPNPTDIAAAKEFLKSAIEKATGE